MRDSHDPPAQFEVHDPDILAHARAVLDACRSPQEMQEAVLAAVQRNEDWRGRGSLISGDGTESRAGPVR